MSDIEQAQPHPWGLEGEKLQKVSMLPFWGVQMAAVAGVIWLGWSWTGFALAIALYYIRMFGITAGFHRYLAHRSFKTSRAFQFVLVMLGMIASQKGCLWWAAHHRRHHKYSDQPEDVHSAAQRGFFWSHMGWIIVERFMKTDLDQVKDLVKYPELRWLNKHWAVPPVTLAVMLYLVAGTWGLLWGFLVSTTLLWHGTFCVNSFAHLVGRQRYQTGDQSRNSFIIALITMGEGWHNNHHHYQRSERQGFYWWEIDLTHYVLRALSVVGLVWDLHGPPPAVRESNRFDAAA